MATQKEMQERIDALEAQLVAKGAEDPDADARVADLEARLADSETNNAALEASLAALATQEAADAARADVKMVRLQNEAGSVVIVDEETAKGLITGWTRIK